MLVGFLRRWFRALGTEHGVTLNTLGTADVGSAGSNLIPTLWEQVLNYLSDRAGFLSRFAGPDRSNAMVLEKTDLTRVEGDTIRFGVLGRLHGTPRTNTQELEGQEEKIPSSSFTVTVTYYRHATSIDKIALKQSLIKWPSDPNRLLSNWLARTHDDDGMNQMLNSETVSSVTIYAGSKSSRATLQDGDILTPTQLSRLFFRALQRGCQPIRTTKFGELPWPIFGALMSEIDYYLLTGSDDFKQDVRFAGLRDNTNPVFTGILDMYKGVMLFPFSQVNPGDSMMGTYLRPQARLAANITSTATSATVGPASAVANVNYGKYLPTSGTGRIGSEQFTISGNSANTLTISARGVNNTTAASHTAGDYITLNNVGKVILFGARSLLRGWADKPALTPGTVANIEQWRSYGFERGLGVDYMYGNKAVVGPDSNPLNYAILETSAPDPSNVG